MAGLFGLFNPDKVGPGVSKDAPKKKPVFQFFELYGRKFWRLTLANLLYVLVSLPVLTGGLADVGLTFICRNYAREKNAFLSSDFFDTIRKNWKQALPIGILDRVGSLILLVAVWFYGSLVWNNDGFSLFLVLQFAMALFIAVMCFFMRYYLYFQIVTFHMTVKQVLRNSFRFAVVGMKENLLISGVLVAVYAVAALLLLSDFFWIALIVVLLVYIFFFPAFRVFLIQFTIFPLMKRTMIDPYYREHPEADRDKRLDLNLEVESDGTDPVEESIFSDTLPAAPTEESVIPKQYSEEELNRARRSRTKHKDADEDGTI